MSLHQQDMLKMQTCVLKVNIHCQGCKRKVKKILNKVKGVHAVDVNAEQDRVTVTGVTDPATLINKLAKSGKPASLLETPRVIHQKKTITLPSNDNVQIANIKIINQSDDDSNNVPIPKGMKIVKEVKISTDDHNNELKGSNPDGVKAAKGKGIEARKKGTHQKKLNHSKANNNLVGGIESFRNGQGIEAEQAEPMARLPYDYQHCMDAVVLNQPQYPMANVYLQPGSGGGHRSPPPPPAASNHMAHIFNDENANGCRIM